MFTVRAAAAADVPAVLPMVRAICAQHEAWDPTRYPMRGDVVEMYERWLPQRAADPRSVFLVAENDGALAGFLVATIEANIPIYTLSEFGFIHDVWVDPAQRGRGIGAALVDEAVRRFRAIGVAQVRLETAHANDAARRLFESRGFRVGAVDMLRNL